MWDHNSNVNEDPFDSFGHGIKAYFNMIESMIKVFSVFTLMFTPVIYLYYIGGQYANDDGLDAKLGMFSLGNLGHSETYCEHSFLALNADTHVDCPSRSGHISKIKAFGIMPNDGDF